MILRILTVVSIGLLATACGNTEQTRYITPAGTSVAYTTSSEQDCADYGFPPGTIGYNNCVVFQIWSIPTGRTVTFSKPAITNVKIATDVMEYVDKDLKGKPLPAGSYLRVEYPTNGFWSTVVRTVRDASGNVIHQDSIFSKYVRVTGLTLIGRAEGDPRAGTRFPNPNPWPNFAPPGARSAD